MAKPYSVININGKRYGAAASEPRQNKPQLIRPEPASRGVIDGFTRPKPASVSVVQNNPQEALPRKIHPPRHKKPAHGLHYRTRRASTLARTAVKKPSAQRVAEPLANLQTAKHQTSLDAARAIRAKAISKSTRINRFKAAGASDDVTAPRQLRTASVQTNPVPAISTARPAPELSSSFSSQKLERLLDQALIKADAHKNARAGKFNKNSSLAKRALAAPKWRSLSAALAILFILGGYFAWQNIPQLSLKMAASRANVAASVPGYTPSGFSFTGPISYADGAVSLSFRANGDNARTFTIVQQKSAWDSQALAVNELSNKPQVQTSQVNGKTVYIYGPNNDATWVDSGIRYTISGKASLTSDQVLKIAGSL